jgi:hypothetical protein
MSSRRPSMLHVFVTLLLACQSLVASAALPFGCAAWMAEPAASAAVAPDAAGGHVHCAGDGAAVVADAVPVNPHGGHGEDPADSSHGSASCHCLHSNGCLGSLPELAPPGLLATQIVLLVRAGHRAPFLATEHRPPIAPAAS